MVAVRFPCCGRYYACHACHVELERHAPRRWPRGAFDRRAVLCGACGTELEIAAYLASPDRCPRCDAPFNPACVDHHPLYFDVASDRADEAPPQADAG